MSDVELFDFRDRGYRTEIRGGESVSGVNGKPKLGRQSRCFAERFEWRAAGKIIGVFAGVKLDCFRPDFP